MLPNLKIKINKLSKTKIDTRKAGAEFVDLLRLSFFTLLFVGIVVPNVQAEIPAAALTDELFKQGYLNVALYGVSATETAANNTPRLNQAIKDAYNYNNTTTIEGAGNLTGSLAVYIPEGTYLISDTIRAHTDTGSGSNNADKPGNHITIVGSTKGTRPKLKLARQANNGFNDSSQPKVLLDFRNGTLTSGVVTAESSNEGYHQMLRGVDLDCNANGSDRGAGCIALYFHQAQNSSVENVNITVTNAHTGIRGTAGSAGGFFNVTITGGKIGIDTQGDLEGSSTPARKARPGVVFAGITLKNQIEDSIVHKGIAPLTIVGFEIETPASLGRSALTIQSVAGKAQFAAINLIDGVIRLGAAPAVAAIDNTNAKNFYARNVYLTQTGSYSGTGMNMIKSSGTTYTSTDNDRKRIKEYNYTITSADSEGRESTNLIDGTKNTTSYDTLIDDTTNPAVPTDIVTRHVWSRLPSVDDTETDAFDVRDASINPGTSFSPISVDADDFQDIIENHQKIFLPKGIYKLTGPITLKANTVLYGAGRGLTRIEADLNYWDSDPTTETAVITTANSTTATTYLGNLSIGVDVSNIDHDYFTALNWQAGASSMVHTGLVYRTTEVTRETTQPHSLIKITNNGGGRWYFTGSIKTKTSQDTDVNNLYNGAYRVLKAINTSQPLWLYALNAEHVRGVTTFLEFNNADNVRIYGLKSEFNGEYTGDTSYVDKSSVVRFTNGSDNVALFGHSSLRYVLHNYKGAVEFVDSEKALATLIAPQAYLNEPDPGPATGRTIKETISGTSKVVEFPKVLTLYKRGIIGDMEDGVMVHTAPSY